MDVVIIGAGAAGLFAAKTLLQQPSSVISSVVIVESLSYIGGRIKADKEFISGHCVDLGAEYIHGFETLLTQVVDDSREEWESRLTKDEELITDIFICAHADGGPQDKPTRNGEYGVYYVGKEKVLLKYDTDDEDFCYLTKAIDNLKWEIDGNETQNEKSQGYTSNMISLGTYLDENVIVPSRMLGIMKASFGNTAGCTNLHKISLSATIDFEHYWEENEIAGDTRLSSKIGMVGIVESIMQKFLTKDDRFSIHLNWTVKSVIWNSTEVKIISMNGEIIHADKVVITVPPNILLSKDINFHPQLPSWKVKSFEKVGMDRAIKVIVKLNKRLWPEKVQNVIAGDMPIPEIWFRTMSTGYSNDEENQTFYLAIGFLTSEAAENLADKIDGLASHDRNEKAAWFVLDQLSEMFQVDKKSVEDSYVSAIIYDWNEVPSIKGGYMYPKVGIEKQDFYNMAKPLENRLFFAGEATNTGACCTVQAAMETGVRAAEEIIKYGSTI